MIVEFSLKRKLLILCIILYEGYGVVFDCVEGVEVESLVGVEFVGEFLFFLMFVESCIE